jgi:hypothetical protein
MAAYNPSGNLRPDRGSKYRRPRRPISLAGLLVGLVLGIAGGLVYAWVIDTRVEFDTEPWQLKKADRAQYIVAIALDYSYDGDLARAIERLIALKPQGDPIQEVADVACDLATTGYVENSSGLRAIQAMMTFYQLQGRSGCADTLIAPIGQPTSQVANADTGSARHQDTHAGRHSPRHPDAAAFSPAYCRAANRFCCADHPHRLCPGIFGCDRGVRAGL